MTLIPEQQRREEIAGRVEAATEGPWLAEWDEEDQRFWIAWKRPDYLTLHTIVDEGVPLVPSVARFIAHAREDIPWLLDQLEQAEQRLVLIHRNATSWHATEAGKDRALAVIADWASGEEIPQVLLDDLAAQSKESEDSCA